jgi:hypothetical protein
MFQVNIFKSQEAHFILCLISSKTLPIWNNEKDKAEGDKPQQEI